MERARPGELWRHPEFLKLWAGQTVSLFGTQITALALPLTAVLTLGASAGQMGLLRAAQSARRCCWACWPARGSTGCAGARS